MKPARALLGLVLLGLAFVAGLLIRPHSEAGQESSAENSRATKASPIDQTADGHESRTTADKAVVTAELKAAPRQAPAARLAPAFDTPFKDSFDALLDAAEHGDAQAGCRLVAEAQRCSFAKSHLRNAPLITEPKLGDNEEWMRKFPEVLHDSIRRDQLEQYERQLEERALVQGLLDACGDVDFSANAQAAYITVAARAGDVGAQLEYVKGQHLGISRIMDNPQLMDQFRLNARPYFMNALESGDLRVIPLLWVETQGLEMGVSPFLPEEWIEPGFVSALIRNLTEAQRNSVFSHSLDRYDIEPDHEQAERARDFYDQYFANTPPGPSLREKWTSPQLNDPKTFLQTMFNDELDRCR